MLIHIKQENWKIRENDSNLQKLHSVDVILHWRYNDHEVWRSFKFKTPFALSRFDTLFCNTESSRRRSFWFHCWFSEMLENILKIRWRTTSSLSSRLSLYFQCNALCAVHLINCSVFPYVSFTFQCGPKECKYVPEHEVAKMNDQLFEQSYLFFFVQHCSMEPSSLRHWIERDSQVNSCFAALPGVTLRICLGWRSCHTFECWSLTKHSNQRKVILD